MTPLFAVFVFGAIVGSFLNVCIVRLPTGAVPLMHCCPVFLELFYDKLVGDGY